MFVLVFVLLVFLQVEKMGRRWREREDEARWREREDGGEVEGERR